MSLSVSQVLSCRHFCNKMWQTLRFTLGVLGDNTTPVGDLEEVKPPIPFPDPQAAFANVEQRESEEHIPYFGFEWASGIALM